MKELKNNIILLLIATMLTLTGWFGNRFFESTLLSKACLVSFCITPLIATLICFTILVGLLIFFVYL